MKSQLQVDTEKPEAIEKVLSPGIDDNKQVRHEIISVKNQIRVETETETLGQLRGATDGVFRLTGLAKKILEK